MHASTQPETETATDYNTNADIDTEEDMNTDTDTVIDTDIDTDTDQDTVTFTDTDTLKDRDETTVFSRQIVRSLQSSFDKYKQCCHDGKVQDVCRMCVWDVRVGCVYGEKLTNCRQIVRSL